MRKKHSPQNIIDQNSSVFIATFSQYEKGKRLPINGFIDQLLSFFLPKVKNILLLDQPHLISDSINPIIELYTSGKLHKRFSISSFWYFPIYLFCKIPSNKKTRTSYKLRDFFSVLYAAFTTKEKYDLFIGLESINVLAGILLKKLGKVTIVVYYVSDYSPIRFGKTLFNSIYLFLDHFCVQHADVTWDVSPAMKEGRLLAGLDPKYVHKIIHVPNALFPNQISSLPISQRIQNSLVYMGILYPDMGPDLAIRAMGKVIKKIPTAKLHIIGGTKKDVDRLKRLVERLDLGKHVSLYGFIDDSNEMSEIIKKCMIGVAPYRAFLDSYRWYGDAGKIRQYLASGLPVVTTHVPPLGRLVAQKGAALMTKDTPGEFSKGIIRLLSDKNLYKQFAEKAKELSRENTWENTYTNALDEMRNVVD